MSEPVALAPFGEGCACVAQHVPSGYVAVTHHVLPLSWGGPDEPGNKVLVCSNTHEATHRLIDDHIRFGGEPPWEHRRRFNPLARDLAARAWAQRPDHPTYTLFPAYVTPDVGPLATQA